MKTQRMRREVIDISGGYLYNSLDRAGGSMLSRRHEKARIVSGPFLVTRWVLIYSVQRLKTREPLVPPKPKEFESA